MQKIVPALWFQDNAEDAMQYYVNLFSQLQSTDKPSKIVSIERYPDEAPIPQMEGFDGKVLNGIFELAGYRFICLDGGPVFQFTPAVSFFIRCNLESDVDLLWNTLSDGGTAMMPLDEYPFSKKYGWVQDKYGISWQIIFEENADDQKIVPSLMFIGDQAGNAESAMKFYTSLFENSKVGEIARYGEEHDPKDQGTVMYGEFELAGQYFTAMDSAYPHEYEMSGAISFFVECDDQAEVDKLWEHLSAVPEAEACGWCKDKFNILWQIVPKRLGELLNDSDPEKSKRVMNAMLAMKKIEITGLEAAYQSQPA